MAGSVSKERKGGRRARINASVGFLESMGAIEIKYDHKIGGKPVDLFAVYPDGRTVVIECGALPGDRIITIANEVSELYWIPVMPMLLLLVDRGMNRYYSGTGYVKCNKCEWEWEPRVKDPAICPRCKSPDWNKEEVKNVGK